MAAILAFVLALPVWSETLAYITRRGDRLEEIARKHGISLSKLIQDNRASIPNPNKVFAGIRLKIQLPPGRSIPSGSVALPASPNRPAVPAVKTAERPSVRKPDASRPTVREETPVAVPVPAGPGISATSPQPSKAQAPENIPGSALADPPVRPAAAAPANVRQPSSPAAKAPVAAAQTSPNAPPQDYDELLRQEAQANRDDTSLRRIAGSLTVVCVLIIGSVWALRQMKTRPMAGWLPQKGARSSSMRLVETLYLFPTRSAALHLVEVAGKVVLLGTTSNHVQLLLEIQDKEAVEPKTEPVSAAFGSALNEMRVGYEAARREEEWKRPTEDVRSEFRSATDELLRTVEQLRNRKDPQDGRKNHPE
ncbi:MAG: flagellar biosynthetic protein FliO [Armatimonadetes bacterium]|nr:flagellar biosynthetic protein FliO [Armatimonadota bacterium]